MTVLWLPRARRDIDRIYDFLVEEDARAAERAMRTIGQGAELLESFPRAGRPMGDETGRREIFRPFGAGAYVLRYRIHRNTVVVLRVWHSREGR